MLNESSEEVRTQFLKEFTRELLTVTKNELDRGDRALKEQQRIQRRIATEKLKKKYVKEEPKSMQVVPIASIQPQHHKIQETAQFTPSIQISVAPIPIQKPIAKPIAIPQAPITNTASGMNLGKIETLIRDNSVSSIECPGPEKRIIIKKNNQTISTDISLNKSEVDTIIKDFSEKARIPLIEGMLRARVANLQISAIVSKVSDSRWIITKTYTPQLPTIAPQMEPAISSSAPIIKPQLQSPQSSQQRLSQQIPIDSLITRQMPAQQSMQARYPQQMPIPIQRSSAYQEEKKESIWNKKIKFGK